MSAAVQHDERSVPIPMGDACVIARTLADLDLAPGDACTTEPNRTLVMRLADAPPDGRLAIWEAHLATLPAESRAAWAEAVSAASHDDAAPDDGWGQPLAFRLPPVGRFPLDILPIPLSRLIREGARSIGCPPDFLALPGLVVAGAAIGRSVVLELKAGYRATAGLFAACVGDPGDGKSPAVNHVVAPLCRIDEERYTKWLEAKAEYEVESARYDLIAKAARRSRGRAQGADECGDEDGRPIVGEDDALLGVSKPVAPVLRRTVIRDITTEAMDAVLEQNPRGLLQVLDEASTLTASMNQYRGGKGSDRQWYMSTWSGQDRIVDRKGNAGTVPIRVPNPFLAVVGGMVPDMIGSFCEEKGRHDGFLDRILFAYPDPIPKDGWREEGVSEAVRDAWTELVRRLHDRPLRLVDSQLVPDVVHFTDDAKREWVALIDAHHAEQRSFDFPRSLTGPWAKLEQYAGRITLVLHLLKIAAESGGDSAMIPDVKAKTVREAARILAYLKGHTRRVHALMKSATRGAEGNDDVQCILKWIHRHRPEAFSLRDLKRDLSRTFHGRAQALEDALGWLVAQRVIKPQASAATDARKGPGRAKSSVYLVNPHLLASQNCQNHGFAEPSASGSGAYGDSGEFATEEAAFADADEDIPF